MKVEKIEIILSQVKEYLGKLNFADEEVPTEEISEETAEGDHSSVTLIDALADQPDGSFTITLIKAEGKISEFEVHSMEAPEEVEEEVEMEVETETKVEETKAEEVAMSDQVKGLADSVKELSEAYELKLAEEKAKYEAKLAEIGKSAGESKVIQAPVQTQEKVKLSRLEAYKESLKK